MQEVDSLIFGLEILKAYKPSLSLCSSHRARRTLEVQEVEFTNITDADRDRLTELGWWTNGTLLWVF